MERFFQYTQNGDTEAINRYLEKLPLDDQIDALNSQDPDGNTPMHYAASYGYLDICQKFIEIDNEQRSFIDIANANKETPLHLAANNHHLDICQFLIDNGAIIDAKVF